MANSDLKEKTILLVNSGSIKKKFILQRLKALGLTIIVLNKEKNWAQPYVDHWIITDNKNYSTAIQDIERFLANNPQVKIDGALTFWEDDVLLTSKIIDKFGLIGIPFSVAQHARNKFLFRKFCTDNNLPAPKFYPARSKNDIDRIANTFNFPVVVKPAYGASSAFVIRADSRAELLDAFTYIRGNISANIESALTDGLDIFVEEYIDGDEVDIDVLVQNGKIKFHSISDNFNKARDIFFFDSGQSIPSNLPESDQAALYELVEETLEKMGIQNGCIHFEAKSTKTAPIPIEVNLRMGGDYIYSYTKDAWGVDLVEMAARIALGQYVKIRPPQFPKKYIIGWDIHPENSGILVELSVDKQLKNKKYVEEVHIDKQIGDAILIPPEGYEHIGWITVSGDNYFDAQDNLESALKYIKYRVAKYDFDSFVGKTLRKDRFSSAVTNKNLLLSVAKAEVTKRRFHENQRNLKIGILFDRGNDDDHNHAEIALNSAGYQIKKALIDRDYDVEILDASEPQKIIENLKRSSVDIALNITEESIGASRYRPHVAAVIDMLQIPYTGSDFFTLGLSQNKIEAKKLLEYHEIPTPKWDYAYDVDDEIDDELVFPLIVKPAATNNSAGITNNSIVDNKKDLRKQLKTIIKGLNSPAIVEEYIEGDEFDVSILGNDEEDYQVLPLTRSTFNGLPNKYQHIYTHEAKWLTDGAYKKIVVERPPKNLSRKLGSLITEIALDAYKIFGCRDYGRVDVRVDREGNPYVLEVNPNPSLAISACIPAVAKLAGYSYGELIEEIISLAIRRYQKETKPSIFKPEVLFKKINGHS